jgi:hypothetical protein
MQIYLPELHRVIQDDDFKSIVTPRYNCVGFAIGDPNWWDHVGEEGTTWPADLIGRGSLNDYLEVFRRHGFQTCDRAEGTVAMPGWENIAIFHEGGEFSHVAIQLASGCWVSKLGGYEVRSRRLPAGSLCPPLRDTKNAADGDTGESRWWFDTRIAGTWADAPQLPPVSHVLCDAVNRGE